MAELDEAALGAWQAALAAALLGARDVDDVRVRLRDAAPWAGDRIAALDDRAVAVALDLARRWSPHTLERG